jgi:hypothetical protein
LPYARILDRMVTIKDGRGARQVTAEEAFLLYLRKKALDGNEAAQERLEGPCHANVSAHPVVG